MNEPSEKELLRREAAMFKAEAIALSNWLVDLGHPSGEIVALRDLARESVIFPIRRTGGQPAEDGHTITP